MPKPLNLLGETFGRLKVVEFVGRHRKYVLRWLCQCSCGNTRTVSSGDLRSGHTRSCGCIAKDKVKGRIEQLAGKKFGKLTLVKPVDNRLRDAWLCQCECGQTSTPQVCHVISGLVKSCGCARSDNVKSVIGCRFGRLKAVEIVSGKYIGCNCDCGTQINVLVENLRSGRQQSCGCYFLEVVTKHGHAVNRRTTREYNSWQSMKRRCTTPTATGYENYGGRGIKVCDRWMYSFENFLTDMGPRPKGTSINRIDNDGDYEPGNCEWATPKEQTINKRPRKRAA